MVLANAIAISTPTSVISTRKSLILKRTSVNSIHRLRFAYVECDFNTRKSNFHSLECIFYQQGIIFSRMSVIATRKLFVILTRRSEMSRRMSVISTRREQFPQA
jgi:hypothetical protein